MIHPFDLQKFLAGAHVTTRDGRPVRQLTYFQLPHDTYPLHGIVEGMEAIGTWTKEGNFRQEGGTSDFDLVIHIEDCDVPEKSMGLDGVTPIQLATAMELFMADTEMKGNVTTFVAFVRGIHAAETHHGVIRQTA